jgi:hypothetical protein
MGEKKKMHGGNSRPRFPPAGHGMLTISKRLLNKWTTRMSTENYTGKGSESRTLTAFLSVASHDQTAADELSLHLLYNPKLCHVNTTKIPSYFLFSGI